MTGSNGLSQRLHKVGLKQADLARRVGVHPNTVSAWATDKKTMPGAVKAYLDLLAKIKELAA